MIIRKPVYYDTFRCIAGACPDSCCQEWEVQVDAEAAARYKALGGELGEQLRSKLKQDDQGEYYLEITDRRCPMWQQDGLCRIQCQLGEEGLCKVCREFPRLRHDYGDFVELDLELSCPEAARLILYGQATTLTQEFPEIGEAEYDTEAMEILLRSREEALRIFERHPLPDALALLLLYAYQVQEELDGGEGTEQDTLADLAMARRLAAKDAVPLWDFYKSLELLTPRWKNRLEAPQPTKRWQEELGAVARYGIRRYWLQAVSDYDLICRVKLVIASCILIRSLGGDILPTAQLYSKEIENSGENVESILDGAYSHPALTDINLLGLIFS